MDYVSGMSSAQGLAQRYSADLATRASEIRGSVGTALELGSQYQSQLTNYKNMMDKTFETLGEVGGEALIGKAFALAKGKYLASKEASDKIKNDAEIANNNDVAPSAMSATDPALMRTETAEPDINMDQEGRELTEMTSMKSTSEVSGESLGSSLPQSELVGEGADTGARGSLSAEDVNSLTFPAETDAETATGAVAEDTGISAGTKIAEDATEDASLDATGIGEVLMGVQLVSGVGEFFKNLIDPNKPTPPPPSLLLPPTQQANFIQASVQQGT